VLIIASGGFLAWQFLGSQNAAPKTVEEVEKTGQKVTLNFWGVYDDPSVFEPIIKAYETQHPNVKINYTRKDASIYEFISLNELASQDGPDVWMIPLEWLPKHLDKLTAVPDGLLASQNIPPTPKKRFSFSKPSPIPGNAVVYAQTFAPVTAENNIVGDKVATLPLSVDTLGIYGNLALLQQNGISGVPTTWEQVVTATKTLTKRNGLTIDQPAIALGTSNNIARASDILAALLMQNHTPMISNDKLAAQFNDTVTKTTGEPIKPGELALDFYTSFASPTKETYTWNASKPQDFDLFIEGKLPFFIDYSYRVNDIIQRQPTLPFITGPLPQITGTNTPLTVATAQMIGVPSVSSKAQISWDFISFLTNKENSLKYARAAGRPPARQSLVTADALPAQYQPFVAQIPTAATWYRTEISKTNTVFKSAIDAILSGQTIQDVTNKLTKQVTHILRNESYD
jgi:ABC-type glycerol-3-phosphate transport system substrate-binding protein